MASTRRFRFRDSENLESDSGYSSVSSTLDDDESKLESMTAKGINRLCSELLELKKASDEDFHRTVYLNYAAFIRIFEKLGGMENELTQLKQHVSTQRKLVKDLTDGIDLEIMSKELVESIVEESLDVGPPMSLLESHTNEISETIDILLSEHRLDEAMAILEMEAQNLKRIQLEEDSSELVLMFYNSSISERRLKLADQFASVADHERVAAPEFQKALSGLCRLGDGARAAQLLLKYYRLRLAKGVQALQSSKAFMLGTYIRELARFVYSVISQAARSFVLLYGEKSPYASELIKWAHEETEVFVCCFHKYVKSISEINGGLTSALEAMESAISFCLILEVQSIVLCPFLVKLIRPCMEEVLKMHINHFKKVIGVFTATDTWVLGKYLIPAILNEEAYPAMVGHRMEYCLLTSSGRKFVTLLQATMKEISSLVNLRMENSILNGLMDLFREYITNLERAIPHKAILDEAGPRIVLAQTLSQQLSVLANSSALVRIFSSNAQSIFEGIKILDGHLTTDNAVGSLSKELDNWIFSIQGMENQLRNLFYQEFVCRVVSTGGSKLSLETYMDDQSDSDTFYDLMPSVTFQAIFSELRKVEKIGKDVFIEEDWLVEELLRELMQTIFTWFSNNGDIWKTIEDASTVQRHGFKKFVLDMHFLVELTRFGGYFSDNSIEASSALISRMEVNLLSAGLDVHSDVVAQGWAKSVAIEAINKLLEIEKTESLNEVERVSTYDHDPNNEKYEYTSDDSVEDSIIATERDGVSHPDKDNDLDEDGVLSSEDTETQVVDAVDAENGKPIESEALSVESD